MKLEHGWFDVTKAHNDVCGWNYRVVVDSQTTFPEITITVSAYGADFRVSVSGWELYLKPRAQYVKTMEDAEQVIEKIMKYVNYGRFELGITQLPRE
jgi:hypothetical protein